MFMMKVNAFGKLMHLETFSTDQFQKFLLYQNRQGQIEIEHSRLNILDSDTGVTV